MPKFRDMLNHEFLRPRNDEYLCDVYDSEAWKDLFGSPVYPNNRIGLLFCTDAIPAFAQKGTSLKPGILLILSLAPTERGKSENMHMWYIMPTSIKGVSQKKYFDFFAKWDLNDLHFNGTISYSKQSLSCFIFLFLDGSTRIMTTSGVDGVKATVYTTSMDTPGRSELMGLWIVSHDRIPPHTVTI